MSFKMDFREAANGDFAAVCRFQRIARERHGAAPGFRRAIRAGFRYPARTRCKYSPYLL